MKDPNWLVGCSHCCALDLSTTEVLFFIAGHTYRTKAVFNIVFCQRRYLARRRRSLSSMQRPWAQSSAKEEKARDRAGDLCDQRAHGM